LIKFSNKLRTDTKNPLGRVDEKRQGGIHMGGKKKSEKKKGK
jgi:hypothetical protein